MSAIEMETDPFTDPEPTKREVTYDGWGRYKLPHPDNGKERGFTRVTTIAGALEDQYHLKMWDRRKMLEGLVIDRGPLTLAERVFTEYGWDPQSREAKDKLDDIAKHVLNVADVNAGSKMGTALHAITEDDNQGHTLQAEIRAEELGVGANLVAYRDALTRHQIEVLPQYMERLLFIRELGAVGRTDNLTREVGRALLRVFDLKSQKTMDFGALKIAIQLAMYANAEAMFNEDTWKWEEMPPVDKTLATVAWLPVLVGREEKICHLYDVDLEWGWRWAKASVRVRTARKDKPLSLRIASSPAVLPAPTAVLTPKEATAAICAVVGSGPVRMEGTQPMGILSTGAIPPQPTASQNSEPQPLDWEARFRQAKTIDELTEIGKECHAEGAMTDSLKDLGRKLRTEILEEISK